MKSLFLSLIACSAAFVMAAETALIPTQTADWQKINGRGTLSVEKINGEEVFAVKGQANYRSEKMLKIAPEKIYKLTGEFMSKPGGTVPAKLYFGFMPFPKEYDLFFYMLTNRNIALSREKLISEVWGYDFFGDARTLDTHIKLLRKSLGPYAKYIVTLRGVGYRFEGN